jgi:hypothetical protein
LLIVLFQLPPQDKQDGVKFIKHYFLSCKEMEFKIDLLNL